METRLKQILSYYRANHQCQRKWDNEVVDEFHDICFTLLDRDYEIDIMYNTGGALCGTYPAKMYILRKERFREQMDSAPYQDWSKLQEYVEHSKNARVKGRFPVPVILWRSKSVSRSSTLSRGVEIVLKSPQEKARELINDLYVYCTDQESDPLAFIDKARASDIQLLKLLGVRHICDLMTEDKKKYCGLSVCSSEKADYRNRYNLANFKISSIPYPGVEFFTEFKENGYCGERLRFNWTASGANASLSIRKFGDSLFNWKEYKNWDIIVMTQNYIQYLLQCLVEGDHNSGILVHCISGWDRTPLFVSLIRILLWAEGEAHQSLNTDEFLYLTLAYDWFLFCHQFAFRFSRGEEIMHFCFRVLKYLVKDEYSLAYQIEKIAAASELGEIIQSPSPSSHSTVLTEDIETREHVVDVALASDSNFDLQTRLSSTKLSLREQVQKVEEIFLYQIEGGIDNQAQEPPCAVREPVDADSTLIGRLRSESPHQGGLDILPKRRRSGDGPKGPDNLGWADGHGSWQLVDEYMSENISKGQAKHASVLKATSLSGSGMPAILDDYEGHGKHGAAFARSILALRNRIDESVLEQQSRMEQRRNRIMALSDRFQQLYGECVLEQELPRSAQGIWGWINYAVA